MKHNIIGDIHGRTNWKELVDLDCVNVFVGDYFDPYEYECGDFSFESMQANFLEIINLKKTYPDKFVLLYGNHDFHYIHVINGSSRFDNLNAIKLHSLFLENASFFSGICYTFDNIMVSHAGLSKEWYEKHFGRYKSETLPEVSSKVNALWNSENAINAFCFDTTDFQDLYGTSPAQSPIWIRYETLVNHNLFAGESTIQVVGHTQLRSGKILFLKDIVVVDVLGFVTKSYKI